MRDVSRIPLAIVGMACRLPGADSLDDYWRLLIGGESGLGELPPERFDKSRHFDPEKGMRKKSYTSLGGYVKPRPFDLSGYPLPKWLIEQTAESHLNMCEIAASAMEHAGWDPHRPPHDNVGVYIGHAPPMSQLSRMIYARQIAHTAEFLREIPELDVLVGGQTDEVIREVVEAVRSGIAPDDPLVRLRAHAYYLPALLSRQFSLNGPAMAFDAACASSLRALGHGARALQLGEIDMAMVGSASYCHADTLVLFSQAQSVSATGTRPFDEDADGLVAAEGYVVLLVKTLERALADGDRIHSVIRGIGIASDGKGKSLWAPRKEGQMEAIRRAYDDVKPDDLQYIEMHATSTQVGDSTEMSALSEALIPVLPAGMRLPVGSAKANVGHTLETAGLASLVKTVLSMQHRTIPPQINVQTLSSKIEWDRIPFYISPTALPWPDPPKGGLRHAAVNAFGIGGLNVHVVLEEFEATASRRMLEEFRAKSAASTNARPEDEAIAVIGMGAVLPGARTIDQLWDTLKGGAPQTSSVPASHWDGRIGLAPGEDRLWTIPSNVGGFITDFEFDWKKHKIPPKQVQTAAPIQFMLLDAADQALRQSGYDQRPFDRMRTGVVVGTMFSSEFGDELQMGLRLTDFEATLKSALTRRGVSAADAERMTTAYDAALLRHMPALIDETGSFTASTTASRITKTFDLMGGATAIDAGDSSCCAALQSAIYMLRTGECDMMLCASGDNTLSFATFESMARRGMLSRTGRSDPFSLSADGMVPGEGGGALLLKRLSDAQRDGDQIFAVIRGVGAAWSVEPEAGLERAAGRALSQAHLTGDDVAAIEAAANGLPEVDAAELKVLGRLFGSADRPSPVTVSAASAQFGHLGSASGIVALIKAALELEHQESSRIVGANAGSLVSPAQGRQVHFALEPTPLTASHSEGRLVAGVNVISDAGLAYHIVVERPTPVAPPVRRHQKNGEAVPSASAKRERSARWQLHRIGAARSEALRTAIQEVLEGSRKPISAFTREDRWRIAILASSEEALRSLCAQALPHIEDSNRWPELADRGVFVGTTSDAPTVHAWKRPTFASLENVEAPLAAHAQLHLLSAEACLDVMGWLASDEGKSSDAAAPASGVHRVVNGVNVVRLAGTPFEMGRQHGVACAEKIRQVLRRYADLVGTRWDPGSLLDDAIATPEVWFAPDELEELRGVAKGAGVTIQSLIGHQLRLFLDGGAGGAHFAIPDAREVGDGLLHGYNEDLRQGLGVRDCLTRVVQVRVPKDGIPHATLGVAGEVGGLCGMNAQGLSVSASCLLDGEQKPVPGRLLTSVVHQILRTASDLKSAIEAARDLNTSVPCTLLMTHGPSGKSCLWSNDGETTSIESEGALFATNHRGLGTSVPPTHSRHRLTRMRKLLGSAHANGSRREQAMVALRDQFDSSRNRDSVWPTMNTVRRVDNQTSVVMHARSGRLWMHGGENAPGEKRTVLSQYREIDVASLWADVPASASQSNGHAGSNGHVDVAAGAVPKESPKAAAPVAAGLNVTTQADVLRSYQAAEDRTGRHAVCERYVMRVVEAAMPTARGPAAPGAAFLLGDNDFSRALKAALEMQGTRVTLVASGDDVDSVLKQFDAACGVEAVRHLFLLTPHDAAAKTTLESAGWKERRQVGVMLPYRVCQRWYQHVVERGLLAEASVTAVTSLGGDFGFSGQVQGAEGGALSGLLKGVAMETALSKNVTSGFRVKVIDAGASVSPAELASFVLNELAGDPDGKELETGCALGKRWLARPMVIPVELLPKSEIPRESTFVVTGGARGVTAVVARELGLKYGLKLHLIGSSPRPEIADAYHQMSAEEMKEVKSQVMKEALANGEKPADAWSRFEKALEIDRSLRELRAAGVHAVYHGCDVSSRESLGRVLEEIRRTEGPITGVLHGAGFERASRFEKKQTELVDRTYAAKVDGAAALMALTQNDPIRYFAAFGSVSGRFGGVGQTDYSSANDMLAKLIDWYRAQRPEVGAAVFHWHAWDDVGMAVRPESQHIRKLHNIRFMPSLEGAAHLIDELRSGLPEGEIAITELQYCREKYSAEIPEANAAQRRNGTAEVASSAKSPTSRRPMIDTIVELTPDRSLVAEVTLDPVNDLFLKKHLFKGRPMMPVVVTMEILAEAASLVAGSGKRIVAVRNIEIVNGLRFLTDQPQATRVRVTADGDTLTCRFTSDIVNRKGVLLKADQPYLNAVVEVSDQPKSFSQKRPPLPSSWNEIWYPDGETVIYHGEEFRCLKRGVEENGLCWGQMLSPAPGNLSGRRGSEGWIMPSALLDSGFYGSGVMLWVKYQGVVAIPAGIDRVELGRQERPGEVCSVLFHDRGREGNNALYDFTIFGDDGAVLCHVEGYRNVIVAEQSAETMRGA